MAIRLVLDEAHQILTQRDFRPQFTRLQCLAQFLVQKNFLTASLPLRLERQFLMALGLPLSTRIIRGHSDQPQVSYNIVKYSTMNTDEIRLAVDCAKVLELLMEADQQGVIFCVSKKQAQVLHDRFTKCSSYSDLPVEERGHNEMVWKTGEFRWIASTTGLIQGIDLSNIGATIFLGMPYGLLNLYQGSGRGGRDGRKSWSVLLSQSNSQLMIDRVQPEDDVACQREGEEWRHYDGCRRVGFSQLLDGRDMPCPNLPGSHRCDHCDAASEFTQKITPLIVDPPAKPELTRTFCQVDNEPDFHSFALDLMAIDFTELDHIPALSNPLPPSRPFPFPPSHLAPPVIAEPAMPILRDSSHYRQALKTKSDKTKALHALVNMLFGKCVVCWAYQNIVVAKHDGLWIGCQPTRAFVSHLFGWQQFKKKIRFQTKYEYCYKCQLPQRRPFMPTCHPDLGSGDRGSKPCPLEDFVVLLIWFLRHDHANWWARATRAFPELQQNIGEDAFASWVSRVDSNDSFYNGLELVLWFYMERERN